MEDLNDIQSPKYFSHMTEEDLSKILKWKLENKTTKEIAGLLQRPVRTINYFLHKCKSDDTIALKESKKRKPTVLTPSKLKEVKEFIAENPASSIRSSAPKLGLNRETYRLALHQFKLKAYRICHRWYLNDILEKRRLEFAQKYSDFDWRNVIFSDESLFLMTPDANRQNYRIWSEYPPEPIHDIQKHPPKIQVWGAISLKGKSKLVILEGYVNAEEYIKQALEGELRRYLKKYFHNRNYAYYQDLATPHFARETVEYLEDHKIHYFAKEDVCPAAPDVNLIENIWGMIQNNLLSKSFDTFEEFKKELLLQWDAITMEDIAKLYESMPNRMQALIDKNGKGIDY